MPLTDLQIKKLRKLEKKYPEFKDILNDVTEVWKIAKPQRFKFGSILSLRELNGKFTINEHQSCCLAGAYRVGKDLNHVTELRFISGFDGKLINNSCSTDREWSFGNDVKNIVFDFKKIEHAKTIADLNIKFNIPSNLTQTQFEIEFNKQNPKFCDFIILSKAYNFNYKNNSFRISIGNNIYRLLWELYSKYQITKISKIIHIRDFSEFEIIG